MKIKALLGMLICAAACAASKDLTAYFIDVEGGQATLFVTPAGESVLIDAGWPGQNDRDVFYEKVMFSCSGRIINSFAMIYPIESKREFDPIVEGIEKVFFLNKAPSRASIGSRGLAVRASGEPRCTSSHPRRCGHSCRRGGR